MQAKLERVPYFHASMNLVHVSAPAFDAMWHFHPEYELTHIVRGEGMRFVGDSVEPFEAGDLVLIGPQMPHYWICQDSVESRGGPAEAQVCHFLHNFLGDSFWDRPEFASVARLLDRARFGAVLEQEQARQIAPQICELRRLAPARRVLALLDILISLSESVEDLRLLASPAYKPKLKDSDIARLDRVFQLVNKQHARDISLSEAAKTAALSETAFCRYFRSQTGKTFTQFTNEVRIGQACHALLNSDDLIISIAQDCGFRNLSNFNRRFREITGTTPRDYRKRRAPQH
jgi:AraC-like DNA-binding protein